MNRIIPNTLGCFKNQFIRKNLLSFLAIKRFFAKINIKGNDHEGNNKNDSYSAVTQEIKVGKSVDQPEGGVCHVKEIRPPFLF
jgi:hypothetical protein